MKRLIILGWLFAASIVHAQTVRVDLGSSSLFNASGGSVQAYLPNSTVTFSGGVANGRVALGASDSFLFHGLGVTAGTNYFAASVDGAGISEQVFGLTVQSPNLTAFVGSVGNASSSPFFQSSRIQHAGAGLLYHSTFHGVRVSTLGVLAGGQRSGLGSAAWSGSTFRLSGTAGWLNNAPLVNAQAQWALLSFLGFGAYHQTIWKDSQHSTADNVSAFASFGHVTAQASLLRGVSSGSIVMGESAGLGFRFSRVTEQSNFYKSSTAHFVTHTVTESFHRVSVSQTLTQSQGKPSVTFGGGYHSNHFAVDVSHGVLFFPMAGRGFQQVTAVTLSVRIPHTDSSVTLSTNVSPDGRTLYSVSGESYAQLQFLPTEKAHKVSSGKFLVTGTVTDSEGQPVEGAALSIAGQIVYTNAAGAFQVRLKKNQAVTMQVLCEEFLLGRWQCEQSQSTATPGQSVRVIVSKLKGEGN